MKTVSFSPEELKTQLCAALSEGNWGTIGPRSVKAAKDLAKLLDFEEGLLLSGCAAAAETILRALEISFGDEVILPAYCSPFLKNAVDAVGAKAVFCDVDETLHLRADRLEARINTTTRAVFCEEIGGYPTDTRSIANICRENDVPLIDCTASPYSTRINGKSTTFYADFALCILPVQGAAAILTDGECIQKIYASHHCGNPYGTAGGLNTGICLGGDMRIDEWRSVCLSELLKNPEERRRMQNSLKICLWEQLTAQGMTPLRVRKNGESAGTHLMFSAGCSDNVHTFRPPYAAYTDAARAISEGVLFYEVKC